MFIIWQFSTPLLGGEVFQGFQVQQTSIVLHENGIEGGNTDPSERHCNCLLALELCVQGVLWLCHWCQPCSGYPTIVGSCFQVSWLPPGMGEMFKLVCLHCWSSGSGVFVTCNRTAKQNLPSLTFLFSSGLGKRTSLGWWSIVSAGVLSESVSCSGVAVRCWGSQAAEAVPYLHGSWERVHLPSLQGTGWQSHAGAVQQGCSGGQGVLSVAGEGIALLFWHKEVWHWNSPGTWKLIGLGKLIDLVFVWEHAQAWCSPFRWAAVKFQGLLDSAVFMARGLWLLDCCNVCNLWRCLISLISSWTLFMSSHTGNWPETSAVKTTGKTGNLPKTLNLDCILSSIPLCWLSSENPENMGWAAFTHTCLAWEVCIKGLISPYTAWVGGLWIHPFIPTLSASLEISSKAIRLHGKQKWNHLCNVQPVRGCFGRIQRRLRWNLVVVVHSCSPLLLRIWLQGSCQELGNCLFS